MYTHELRKVSRSDFNNLILPSDLVNEAYVGKSETLLDIESKIHDLRSKVTMFNASSTSKEVLEINRLFEKQFGMDIFALKLDKDPSINAYTYTIGRRFDMMNKKMRDFVVGNPQSGYRFAPGNGLAVIMHINVGLLTDERFTDGDIVAVMLHEIGHNFADCIYDKLAFYNADLMKQYKSVLIASTVYYAILSCIPILGLFAVPDLIDTAKQYDLYNNEKQAKKEKKTQKKPRTNRVSEFLGGVGASIRSTYDLINAVIDRLFSDNEYIKAWKTVNKDETKVMKDHIDRQNEVIADKFPAIYGYGIEISHCQVLFKDIINSRVYQATEKLGDWAHMRNDEYEEVLFDINDWDVHPNAIQRINASLNTLKAEVKKDDIDPKIKKEIELQISEIEALVKQFVDETKKKTDIEKAQAIYYQWVRKNAPDPISKKLEETIEQELDKALEANEKKHK